MSRPHRGAFTFNAGNCCGYAMRKRVDDVARVASVDPMRVYATGMSNGAMMCYRLASELSDRIAAIAPVVGPMGTEERYAPFEGGEGEGRSGNDLMWDFFLRHPLGEEAGEAPR